MTWWDDKEPARAAREIARQVTKLADQIERQNSLDYARGLAKRVAAQRKEIARLERLVRDLRADVHERDEIIAASDVRVPAIPGGAAA